MGAWLFLSIWMLLAGVFVLAICSAAARLMPGPVGAGVEEANLSNRGFKLETQRTGKLHPVFWLAIGLAVLVTACAVSNVNRPVSTRTYEPVKGATLLMDHSR